MTATKKTYTDPAFRSWRIWVEEARKALGWSDEDYRRCLTSFGVESSKELTPQDRELFKKRMNAELRKRDIRLIPNGLKGRPANFYCNQRGAVYRAIEAKLRELGRARETRLTWAYAETILERMAGREKSGPTKLEFAAKSDLQVVLGAIKSQLNKETSGEG